MSDVVILPASLVATLLAALDDAVQVASDQGDESLSVRLDLLYREIDSERCEQVRPARVCPDCERDMAAGTHPTCLDVAGLARIAARVVREVQA